VFGNGLEEVFKHSFLATMLMDVVLVSGTAGLVLVTVGDRASFAGEAEVARAS
jgi:hypothetical protein